MRASHTIQTLSGENTALAIKELGHFQASIFSSDFDQSPSQHPATATNKDSKKNREAVYRRLRGIVRERFAGSGQDQDAEQSLISMGSVTVGAEQVENFLLARMNDTSLFEMLYRTGRSDRAWSRFVMLMNILIWPTVEVGSAIMAFGPSHNPFGLVAGFAGLGAFLMSFMVDEMAVRDAMLLDVDQVNRLQAFANRIDIDQPGTWVYHSMDVMVDRSNVNYMLQTGEVNPLGIGQLWRSAVQPVNTSSLLARLAPWLFKENPQAPKSTWIRVDELLTIQEDGSPKLVTLVRVSDSRPRYPVRSKISQMIESMKSRTLRPAQIPVKGSR
ncbi:MAG: hypothetical protein AB7P49_14975 [Bdellovibrionales bacterium]